MEIHIFIVWSKGLGQRENILKDIAKRFEVLQCVDTTWSKDKFSENLSRFYGENLPKNSSKEQHCGTDTFLSVLIRDGNPKYELRQTSKGIKPVNTNMFDAKQLYRDWTGGGHKIHGSDNATEARCNIYLLYGLKYHELLSVENITPTKIYKKDIIGAHGWNSLKEIFDAFNELSNYVVLRNFANIEDELNNLHPDIDILTDNKRLISDISNGKPTFRDERRVQNLVMVNGQKVFFDFRFIGDNYYDYKWQQRILASRILYDNMYVPNKENHFFSLMYHAFVHKPQLSKDYVQKLMVLSQDLKLNYCEKSFLDNNVLEDMNDFMMKHNYDYIEPRDLTVFFNSKVIERFGSFQYSSERSKNERIRAVKRKVKAGLGRLGIKKFL